jgi:hypothetical protein
MGNTTSAVAQQCLLNAVGNDASLVAFPTALLYETVDVNPYNLDYPVTPAAVTFPESADQVAAIVKCAVDADVKVQAKSGGHSYANYGKFSLLCLMQRAHHSPKMVLMLIKSFLRARRRRRCSRR